MKIYINPGHGGNDSGAVGINGRQEKDDNLRYASSVADKLCTAGHYINLERDGDCLIPVGEIAKRANAWGAELFVAFHRNSGGGYGAECLIVSSASDTSRRMAQEIQSRLVAVGFRDRGVKVQDKNTYVLSHTNCPAVTIECGFMDSDADNALFDGKFDEIVNAIADGILAIAGGVRPVPTPDPQPTPDPTPPQPDIPKLTRNLKLTSPMMRGEDVRSAQERLNHHKAGAGTVDGVFGKNTKAATIRFQKARIAEGDDIGAADGIIGPRTWAVLWQG